MSTTTCTATRATASSAVDLDPHDPYVPYDPFALGGAALLGARPLAPPLERLLRFVAVTEELAALRAQLASRVAEGGPAAVTGATRLLLAAFEEDADGAAPPYRKAAALIRPLSLATAAPAPRSALAVDLPHRLLAREFGAARVVRFEDVDFPAALTHEPTRRFLRETGLPEDAALSHPADVPLATVAEHPTPHGLPSAAHRLVRLGTLAEDAEAVLDGTTGEVWIWSTPEATLHPLAKDVSTLTYALWLLHDEKHPMPDAYDRLALLLVQSLTATTPQPPAPATAPDWHFWTRLLAG